MKARLAAVAALAALAALALTTTASAEPLEDGDYAVSLPDGTAVAFTVSGGGANVTVSSVPEGFVVSEDSSSDGTTTRITDGDVTVEIETGAHGKIEVDGVTFAATTTLGALLPGTGGMVGVTIDGDDVDVDLPAGFEVVDLESDEHEVEIRISDGRRTFEIEIERDSGSIEITLEDDDAASGDDDSSGEDDDSDDSPTDNTVLDDSSSGDDNSSDDTTTTTVTQTTQTTIQTTTTTTSDDDSSSADDDSSGDDGSDDPSEDDDSSD